MSTDAGLGIIVAGQVGAFLNGANTSSRSIGPIVANVTIEERHVDELDITDHPVERGATISDHAFKRPSEVVIRCAWSNSPSSPGTLSGGIAGAIGNKIAGILNNAVTGAASRTIGGSALGNLAVAEFGSLTALGAQFNTGRGKGTTSVQDVYQQLLQLQRSAIPFSVYTGKRKYDNMLIKTLTVETDLKTENSLMATLVCREVIIVQTQVNPVSASASQQKNPEKTAPIEDSGTKQATQKDPTSNPGLQKSLDRVGGGS